MNYHAKYVKYKTKYLNLLYKIGGQLERMPQLCFGTVQDNLVRTLSIAFSKGICHIDGANAYGGETYYNTVKEALKRMNRENIWITWKSDNTTPQNLNRIIDNLECTYIDTFLVHHAELPTSEHSLEQLYAYQLENPIKIRHIGISNCEDLSKLAEYKERFNISTIQIQAREGRVYDFNNIEGLKKQRDNLEENFIENVNSMGINIMLYATTSGFTNSYTYFLNPEYNAELVQKINKYYYQKYCAGKDNILMIGSVSGSSIETNISMVREVNDQTSLLPDEEIDEINKYLKEYVVQYM